MMLDIAKICLWIGAGLIVYAYIGYPLLVWILQAFFRSPVQKADIKPFVSVLIPAYNEADVIESKLRNVLDVDYPADRMEIVVASDGSSDGTADIVQRLIAGDGHGRIRLLEFEQNRGKIVALNDAVLQLKGDIVVFSDASAMLQPDAIRALVSNFADARVGAVSGTYRVIKPEQSTLGGQEEFYWQYETFLKRQESNAGCITGAHGALYAIRKELYPFPPAGTINDDLVIPLKILQRGFRAVYEPGAVAYEETREMEGFGRRVRIMAGNVRQLVEVKGLLKPFRPLALFFFVSHKCLRPIVPFAMMITAICTALLWQEHLYAVIGVIQIVFYSLAVLGMFLTLRPKFLRLPFYFCMVNAALLVWVFRKFLPRQQLHWR